MKLNEFATHFEGVKQTGNNQYIALCPAHADKNPSLSIGYSDKGNRIVLHCFAGCSEDEILNNVGLTKKDLYKKGSSIMNTTLYTYYNADGTIAYTKTRIDTENGGKRFFFEQPNGVKNMQGVQHELYNLPAVISAKIIYFVEGEKCANAVINNGGVATTLDTGANSVWQEHYTDYFTDKEVIIIPDNDTAGMKYAKMVLKNIPTAKIVILPDLEEKQDIYDWLQNGHKLEEIDNLPSYDTKSDMSSDICVSKDETQAETIIRLVEENGTVLFHDTVGDPFAAITINGHQEVWSLASNEFNTWLNRIYYKAKNKPVKKESISQALAVLIAKALFDSEEAISLQTRVAKTDNDIWYFLSDSKCRAVKINESGWEIVDKPPILFRKYRHQKSQCLPKRKGDLWRILDYINLSECGVMFVCWLVSCFIPDFPHAMPIFYGEKGAAKTTACTMLKKLIDPSELETLTIQKDPRSLSVNLQQHWFLPFDNVSHIDEETSDTLCRAITGSGIQQRKLFTNADDYIFTFQKCIALNGINNVANRPDLLDRAILVELCRIDESKRKELSAIMSEFEKDLPSILGGIFDTLAEAIKIYPTVKLDNLPRMADFARWGYAIGEALGGLGDEFLAEYKLNQEERNLEVLNTDIVATLMIAFMKDRKEWSGLVSQLYTELVDLAPKYGVNPKQKEFPVLPNVLSRRLNNIRSNLKEAGITFEGTSTMQGKKLVITNEKFASLPSYNHYIINTNSDGSPIIGINQPECDFDEEVPF